MNNVIPPKRLKYEKWNNCDNVIVIDLHNGYSIIAIWAKESNSYQLDFPVTLHLKENTTDMWDLIVDDWSFTANQKTINAAILKSVADSLENGFFDKFIERNEYYFKCSQLGCDLLDKESKGKSNV